MASGMRILRVEMDAAWKHGDKVSVQVPPEFGIIGVSAVRNVYVEVPDSAGKFFYVAYQETANGFPELTINPQVDPESFPLVGCLALNRQPCLFQYLPLVHY